MAQGQFENRRRRRRSRKSPLPAFLLAVLLVVVLILVLTMCGRDDEKDPSGESTGESTVQTTTGEAELPGETTTAPVIEIVTTAPPVETTTAPTTEPETEPTTEPTTEPATEPTTVPTEPETVSELGDRVAELAMDLVGCAYEYGGSGPETFDISGLVYYCFQENDVDVPRALSKQAKYGEEVDEEDLLPGDVLFFWSSEEGKVQYVGIYVGDGEFVAARNSEKPVSVMELNSKYFSERFLFARRFWE